MSKKAAEHHKQAAEHHTHAARHHTEAAKHHESGNHQEAAHHAHTSRAHAVHANDHAESAAKAHMDEHGKKTVTEEPGRRRGQAMIPALRIPMGIDFASGTGLPSAWATGQSQRGGGFV